MKVTVLSGGTILDGSGSPPFAADVLIEHGRIAAVGVNLDQPAGADVVNCRGLAIAPGFVDLHSHSDLQVLENRTEKTLQGVTSEVVGNCGFSPYPCGNHAADLREFANGIFRGDDRWAYANASDYLSAIERNAGAVSVYSLIGHGSLRVALFGQRQGALEAGELDQLDGELQTALSAGAAGFSTGLMYAPGSSAPFEELTRLCKSVARAGKLYATHMRSYSFALLEAVEEQLALARTTGCRLQISHLQAVGQANWDKQRRALDMIEAAAREGIDVEFDIYPYRAGSTVMTQLLPQWALEGGMDRLITRLRNTPERRRIGEEALSSMAQRWSDIFVTSVGSTGNQALVGQNLDQIGERFGVGPVEAAMDLIIQEEGAVNIVSFNQSEGNLRELLTHPLCSVISDGFYVNGRPHPRLHGTFPFLLGQIARDQDWMPLESAIHKITTKPAARLGLTDRGRIAAGLRADLVVFDPSVVDSPATYEEPEKEPVGIVAVYRDAGGIGPATC